MALILGFGLRLVYIFKITSELDVYLIGCGYAYLIVGFFNGHGVAELLMKNEH